MNNNNAEDMRDMLYGYAECALWSSLHYNEDPDIEPIPMDDVAGIEDIPDATWEEFREDCQAFADANADDLADWDGGQAGHDFWLTRNGHGAGFWDRGKGAVGDRLADAARVYGTVDLWIDADGKVQA